jgi:hypothetical protein
MTGSSGPIAVGSALAAVLAVHPGAGPPLAEGPVLSLRATVTAASAPAPMTITLFRWSTDVERAPLLAALAAPPPAPAPPAAPGAGRAGRAAGRGGRAGRGAAPPPSRAARLTAAVQAAPTLGFIWGDGPTGYSIKYAWRAALPGGHERVVLVTDRRLGAHTASWPPAPRAPADEEFTVIELRIDARGAGEAKASLAAGVAVDPSAGTLALERYDAAPVLLEVTR